MNIIIIIIIPPVLAVIFLRMWMYLMLTDQNEERNMDNYNFQEDIYGTNVNGTDGNMKGL